MLELIKFAVVPIVAERNEAGKIVREQPGETFACYTPEDFVALFAAVEQELLQENALKDVAKIELSEEKHKKPATNRKR